MVELLEEYERVVGVETIDELRQIASILKGIKILHINSTRTGGGVAEILSMMVALTNALGIDTQWEIIKGSSEFFQCTKAMHNALQGRKELLFPSHFLHVYESINKENAEALYSKIQEADVVFIHDPQPAAMIRSFPNRKNKWVWRCHIELSNSSYAPSDASRSFLSSK